jgi:glycosyltransferase involved in cell wall biosynthesis
VRVAVVTVQVPFVRGGAEVHADGTVAALRAAGVEVEHVLLPFRWHPPDRVLDHLLAARLWRVDEADRVIAMKYPAYLMPHRDKVVWVLHQHRPAYDLWDHPLGGLRGAPGGEAVRDAIRRADDAWLPEARRVYASSRTVADRLRRFNGVEAQVLAPPLEHPDAYRSGPYGDHLLLLGRLSGEKRVELAIEAMRHVRAPGRLIVAGAPAHPGTEAALRRLVARHGLGDRVEIRARWIADEEKVALLAGARAVAYTAFDEDFGYVPVEAAASSRATVVCTDTGGVADLIVADGETGFVRPPEPRALGEAFDRLLGDRAEAARLGAAARERLDALDLRWEAVVEELLR